MKTKKFFAGFLVVLAVFCMILGGITSGFILLVGASLIYVLYDIRDLFKELVDILKEEKNNHK